MCLLRPCTRFPAWGWERQRLDKNDFEFTLCHQNQVQSFICGITSEEQFNLYAQFSRIKRGEMRFKDTAHLIRRLPSVITQGSIPMPT